MRRVAVLLLLCGVAAAAEPSPIAEGTTVQITDLGDQDAYYADKDKLVGMSCQVQKTLEPTNGWYHGALVCDGKKYDFYQVAVQGPQGPATAAVPTTPVALGETIRIRDIGPGDAYAGQKDSMIGQKCTVVTTDLRPVGGWWDGGVQCDDGNGYFFAQFRFDLVSSDAPDAGTKAATVDLGTRVKITAIGEGDDNHADADKLVGLDCTVSSLQGLTSEDGTNFAGTLTCSDKVAHTFTKVQTTPSDERPMLANATRLASVVHKHAKVRIVEISSEDAYFPQADILVGLACETLARLPAPTDGFYSGEMRCDDGEPYYFWKVALASQ